MESMESGQARSFFYGPTAGDFRAELQQFSNEGFHAGLMPAVAEEAGSSFTALLELPAEQAVELLVHSSETEASPPKSLPEIESRRNYRHRFLPPPVLPSDAALIDRASKLSLFVGNSPSNSCPMSQCPKQEPVYSDPNTKSSSPDVSNPAVYQKSTKREREKKIKEPCTKKSKKGTKNTTAEEGGEKLPYVHVRARRGQATDSHSLAERARREKINARMKLLQELVPGCNKISGTAMVLDEIINHVQYLQRQVEFLSMRLAAVNPRIDFNFDALFAVVESDSQTLENNCAAGTMIMPSMWVEEEAEEGQANNNSQQQLWHQHCEEFHQSMWTREGNSSFIPPETSPLSYEEPTANSVEFPMLENPLKMEL